MSKKSKKKSLTVYCHENNLNSVLDSWDYRENNKNPDEISYGSKKDASWICIRCGESFLSRVSTRIHSEGYCSDCARKVIWERRKQKLKPEESLLATHPHLAAEWDYELNDGKTPSDVTQGSHDSVYWKCKRPNHPSYSARIANRVYNDEGCPICGNREILEGENDLASVYPFLAEQWDYEKNYPKTPKEVFSREGNSYWWKCPICNKSYQATVANRSAGKNHKECSHKGTSFPEQAIYYYIQSAFPDAVNRDTSYGFELDIYIPSIKTAIEYDGIYHKTEESLLRDNNKDKLCKKLGIQLYRVRDISLSPTQSAIRINCQDNGKYDDGFDDAIRIIFGYIAPTIDGIDINTRRDYYTILSSTLLRNEKKSILHTHPEVAKEWHPTKNLPLTPDKVTSGMRINAWWHCEKHNVDYQSFVYSHTRANRPGCPKCTIEKRIKTRLENAAKKKNQLKDNNTQLQGRSQS